MIGNLKERDVLSLGDGMHPLGDYLYLRVRGEARSWFVRGPRINGKKPELGLGSVDRVSLAQAGKERDKYLNLWRDGRDPLAERRAAKEAQANRRTFGEVARLKIVAMKSGWRTSDEGRASTLDTWTRNMERDCAPIAARAIDEITVDEIKRVVSPYWDRGCHKAGRDLIKRIEAVFNYAIAHGWRTAANPAAWTVFKQIWPANVAAKQHRAAMPWQDVPEFIDQVRASDAIAARVIEFAVLTCTRSLETRGARWSEVDFEARTWTVPASRMKMGRKDPLPHVVPLSAQAVALLERVKAEGAKGDLIFPGCVNDGSRRERCTEPVPNSSVWKLTKRLGGDVTTHGFRSTFRDWADAHGVNDNDAERCLAHAIGTTVTRAYLRDKAVERRRLIMQAWADFLDGAEVSNVVTLKAA